MKFGKLSFLVIVISLLERTCQRESLIAPCKSVHVSGADQFGCDGLYSITTQIKLKWPNGKQVYQNVEKKRVMYFMSPYYGWVLSTQEGLQNYMYFYASRLNTSGPTMGVWRPMRNKTINISVICQDPILMENSTDIFDDIVTETVNQLWNDTEIYFLNSSSTTMHKESFNKVQALTLTCIQLVVFQKITAYAIVV